MTIPVSSSYTVTRNQTVATTDEAAFEMDNFARLVIAGHVSADYTTANPFSVGVKATGSGQRVTLKDGSTFSVTAPEAGARAIGVFGSRQFTNGGDYVVDTAGEGYGVSTSDLNFRFINTGSMVVRGDQGAFGVTSDNGAVIVNSGDIEVTSADGAATGAMFGYSSSSSFENSGTIVVKGAADAGGSTGVFFGAPGEDGMIVVNSGLIRADLAIREGTYNAEPTQSSTTVTNAGSIYGDIELEFGADTVINGGLIKGDVLMGQGDDIVDTGAGRVRGLISGGDGQDTLRAGKGVEVFDGGDGRDMADYSGVNRAIVVDLLLAGAQDTGGGGVDTLLSVEDLIGGKGADRLTGSAVGNSMSGGVGDDTLDGGQGADTLEGGTGRDAFLFRALEGVVNVITDLGDDFIDLSGIDANAGKAGNQAFKLVAAFDGRAGLAVLSYDSAEDVTLLMLDTDGDEDPDMVIQLDGDHAEFGDFVL